MRRFLLAAFLAAAPAVVLSPDGRVRPAEASVSILATLDQLVTASTYVVVATAKERYSQWEDLPSGKRIVTYTKLKVDKTLTGAPGAEVWIRTLGGAVGKIGQSVAGEAQITLEQKALFFLTKGDSAVVVTGMAQGHYPLVEADKKVKLVSSPDVGALLPRTGPSISAREVLLGATLDDATKAIQAVKRTSDGKKK